MRLKLDTKEGRRGIVLAAVFLVLQVYLLFIRHYDTMDLEVYPNTRPSLDFKADFAIGQTFRAGMNGLNRIDIMMGTHAKTLDGTILLRLTEWPAPAGPKTDLRTATVPGSVIRDNLYQAFFFPPIAGSKGKHFAFEVSAANPAPDAPGCLWTNEADIYPDGSLLINGRVNGGDLAFRTYASRTLASQAGRIARRWPGPLGSQAFFWLVVALFEASLTAVLYSLPGLLGKDRPDAERA